jgi:RNA polymerase sigma factor (sigma-70 family)
MLEPVLPVLGGTVVALVVGGLMLLTLFALPLLRGLGMAVHAARWLLRAGPHLLLRRRIVEAEVGRPLNLAGLSRPLARFARTTRTLALDLRQLTGVAGQWPDDAVPAPRSAWRESLLGAEDRASPLPALRREVFDWLRVAETLPPADREALAGLGVELEPVRQALTDDRPAAEVVRTLAGLLWGVDERLAAAAGAGYRASEATPGDVLPLAGPRPALRGEDDDRDQRRRWAGTLAEHGRGLSRMAGSYTRSAAEREDLEQDIALALWRALPTFRGESSLKTFAYRVARYCCFRHVRRRRDLGDAADPASVADPAACVESAVLRADQRARIEQALTDLPENLESVLTMHLTGHSYTQIAEALGISERNVSVRLTRARARLRRQLVAA